MEARITLVFFHPQLPCNQRKVTTPSICGYKRLILSIILAFYPHLYIISLQHIYLRYSFDFTCSNGWSAPY
jgi:hypothetical protein